MFILKKQNKISTIHEIYEPHHPFAKIACFSFSGVKKKNEAIINHFKLLSPLQQCPSVATELDKPKSRMKKMIKLKA